MSPLTSPTACFRHNGHIPLALISREKWSRSCFYCHPLSQPTQETMDLRSGPCSLMIFSLLAPTGSSLSQLHFNFLGNLSPLPFEAGPGSPKKERLPGTEVKQIRTSLSLMPRSWQHILSLYAVLFFKSFSHFILRNKSHHTHGLGSRDQYSHFLTHRPLKFNDSCSIREAPMSCIFEVEPLCSQYKHWQSSHWTFRLRCWKMCI